MAMVFPDRNVTPTRATYAVPTVLTSSYVAGSIVSIVSNESNAIGVMVKYVKGDETSVQILVESTVDTGALTGSSNWHQQVTQAATGGSIALVPGIYTINASDCAATQLFTFIVSPVKATGVRVSVKATGGTPTGTITTAVVTGWV